MIINCIMSIILVFKEILYRWILNEYKIFGIK